MCPEPAGAVVPSLHFVDTVVFRYSNLSSSARPTDRGQIKSAARPVYVLLFRKPDEYYVGRVTERRYASPRTEDRKWPKQNEKNRWIGRNRISESVTDRRYTVCVVYAPSNNGRNVITSDGRPSGFLVSLADRVGRRRPTNALPFKITLHAWRPAEIDERPRVTTLRITVRLRRTLLNTETALRVCRLEFLLRLE